MPLSHISSEKLQRETASFLYTTRMIKVFANRDSALSFGPFLRDYLTGKKGPRARLPSGLKDLDAEVTPANVFLISQCFPLSLSCVQGLQTASKEQMISLPSCLHSFLVCHVKNLTKENKDRMMVASLCLHLCFSAGLRILRKQSNEYMLAMSLCLPLYLG